MEQTDRIRDCIALRPPKDRTRQESLSQGLGGGGREWPREGVRCNPLTYLPKKLTTLTRKQSEQNENEQEQTEQEEETKLGI